MALKASVLTDDSLLSRMDQTLLKLEQFFGLISGLAVFALMFLAVYSVGGRNIFDSPVRGYVDWIEITMPLIAIMGISYTQRDGGHIRMDILVGRLRGRLLWSAEFVTTFLVLVLILLLIWGSWAHFQRSFDFAAPLWSRDSTIDIKLPVWPAKLVVPMAFTVLAMRLCIQLTSYGKAVISGTDTPVAVPMIEDAATIAAREAAAVTGREQA
ncbi:TRAP transporter small permease subunit [Sulfitobacter guttiformis]|uniref:TRAP transporter small permease protein n=1 Tax=Sulfitobacter guttiformis TaxID=74349 RepID=A0A420DJI6_9RHOB|nr:TRAP transporter small permease [Sulfitobacter guttiformis]KIN71802.1 TRAP dicarboxylate transporter, DctQ subunit [Sulfitobacter guttiformis KCTC 32187]RKE94382.1 TRAP-type mannitol/chloroaromatic compound transport system permease small subunit [Sulfitobacter guttiformis]